MRALLKAAPEPGALELRDVPAPTPAADEVLLRVVSASICGSDIHIAAWHPMARWTRPPVILGHEFAGTIERVGSAVRSFAVGEQVAVESVIWCGQCPPCRAGKTNVCERRELFGLHRPGGLAELVAVPERLLHRLPPGLSPAFAALAEPTTVAVHAVLRQPPRPADVVLVTGPGPVGLLAGAIARAAGARVLVAGAPSDAAARLPIASALGLQPLDPGRPVGEALKDFTDRPVDAVIECSGAQAAIDAGLGVVRRGGAMTLVGQPSGGGIQLDLSGALRGEVSLLTSYFGTWEDFERSLKVLADGTIRAELLTATYALDDVLRAFEDAGSQRVLKPVVHPNGVAP